MFPRLGTWKGRDAYLLEVSWKQTPKAPSEVCFVTLLKYLDDTGVEVPVNYEDYLEAGIRAHAQFLSLYSKFTTLDGLTIVADSVKPYFAGPEQRDPLYQMADYVTKNILFTVVLPDYGHKVRIPKQVDQFLDDRSHRDYVELVLTNAKRMADERHPGVSFDPLILYKGGRLSIPDSQVAMESLIKIDKPNQRHDRLVNPIEERAKGLAQLCYEIGLVDQFCKLDIPVLKFVNLLCMEYPKNKMAGFTDLTPIPGRGPETKEDVFFHCIAIVDNFYTDLHSAWQGDPKTRLTRMALVRAQMGVMLVKLAYKLEVVSVNAAENKVRVFFLVGLVLYIMTKAIFEPFHEYVFGRFPLLIGFRWMGGGAVQLAEYMQADKGYYSINGDLGPDIFRFGGGDVRRKDQNFIAEDLSILTYLGALLYKGEEGEEDYDVMLEIIKFIMQNTAYHHVNWPGGYRFIIGCLFSGDYNTGHFNTIHMGWIYYSFLVHQARSYGNVEILHASRMGDSRFVAMGDNYMISWHCKYDNILDKHCFDQYLHDKWGMEVKKSDDRICRSLVIPRPNGPFIPEFVDIPPYESEFGIVKARPVEMLKRAFVFYDYKGKVWLGPFRDMVQPLERLGVHVSELLTWDDYAVRVFSLMHDSLAVNHYYYDYFRAILQCIQAKIGCTRREMSDRLKRLIDRDDYTRSRFFRSGADLLTVDEAVDMTRSYEEFHTRVVSRIRASDEERYRQERCPRKRPVPKNKYA